MAIPTLSTVKQFPQKYPAFTEAGIRFIIFNSETNGLKKSGALLRNGRRILIDEEKFFEWLQNNQKKSSDSISKIKSKNTPRIQINHGTKTLELSKEQNND